MITLIISGFGINNILHVKEDQHSSKYLTHMNFFLSILSYSASFYKENMELLQFVIWDLFLCLISHVYFTKLGGQILLDKIYFYTVELS